MKRILFCLIAATLSLGLSAQQIHSVEVTAKLFPDGSAHFTQYWDADVTSGTEFYIPVKNLGKMKISNLQVSENGQQYVSEGDNWKVKRSLEEKSGRCGIVKKGDGVELCWGQGSYGRHIWKAEFDATNLVQGYKDYDGFNFMFINPGIGSIEHAKVTIENATGLPAWNSDNVQVWAFGFNGEVNVIKGKIVCETSSWMSKSNKIIILAGFDKGLVQPATVHGSSFEKLKKKAMRGSDYDSDDDSLPLLASLLVMLPFILGFAAIIASIVIKITGRTKEKKIYGTYKVTGWWREPPQESNLFASYYILEKGERLSMGKLKFGKNLIGACFLKWILEQKAIPQQDPRHPKRYNLKLDPTSLFDNPVEGDLFRMVLAASGDNLILEKGEFERWSRRKYEEIMDWPQKAVDDGKKYLIEKGRLDRRGHSTPEGQQLACHVIQFRNFLKDFTLNNERGVPEVELWKDYLVFAQLYGIADQVTRQLKALYPTDFEKYARSLNMEPMYFHSVINMNRVLATSAFASATARMNSSRSSGRGGFASLGGGGGFSGGGFGGGSR